MCRGRSRSCSPPTARPQGMMGKVRRTPDQKADWLTFFLLNCKHRAYTAQLVSTEPVDTVMQACVTGVLSNIQICNIRDLGSVQWVCISHMFTGRFNIRYIIPVQSQMCCFFNCDSANHNWGLLIPVFWSLIPWGTKDSTFGFSYSWYKVSHQITVT